VTVVSIARRSHVRDLAAVRFLVPLALAVLGLCYTVTSFAIAGEAFNIADEAWFLQVVDRVRSGDVLYRDIAYGAGPLPVYVTTVVSYVVGLDVFAVKLVVVACLAAAGALTWTIGERLGFGTLGRVVIVGSLLYVSPPPEAPPYAPGAEVFALLTLLAMVSRSTTARTAALAGSGAGLAFVCKQNVGVLVFCAFVCDLLISPRGRQRARSLLFASLGCVASAGLCLLPVVVTGAFGRFVDYGFTGKGEYIHTHASYVDALHRVEHFAVTARSPGQAETAFWALPALLPLVALAAAIALLALRARTRVPFAIPLVAASCASALALYPRADAVHVAYVSAPFVILTAYALSVLRPHVRPNVARLCFVAVSLVVAAAVVLVAKLSIRTAVEPDARLSTIPHFRGAFISLGEERKYLAQAEALRAAAGSRPLFILVPNAAFAYLTAGIRNPTAFDFPYNSTFGRDGERRVVDEIAAGRIRRVCLGDVDEFNGREPQRLVRYVRANMDRGAPVAYCTLYTRRS